MESTWEQLGIDRYAYRKVGTRKIVIHFFKCDELKQGTYKREKLLQRRYSLFKSRVSTPRTRGRE